MRTRFFAVAYAYLYFIGYVYGKVKFGCTA